MKEKIFSKNKWFECSLKKEYPISYIFVCFNTWVIRCDGLTKEQCEMLGYLILDEWCV